MGDALDPSELESLLAGVNAEVPRDPRYSLAVRPGLGGVVLEVKGMVLQGIPDEFSSRLGEVFAHGTKRAVIDLRACTYICSSALGVVMQFFQAARTADGQVVMIKPNDKVRKLVQILGFTDLIVEVEDEAMAEELFRKLGV